MENNHADHQKIKQLAQDYANAFLARDMSTLLTLLTDDITALTPNKPPICGKIAVQRAMQSDLASIELIDLHFSLKDIETDHRLAYAWGLSQSHIRFLDEETSMEIPGKFLWILEKDHQAIWRIKRDCTLGDI